MIERMLSSYLLETALAAVDEGVVIVEVDSDTPIRILYSNPAFARLTGYTGGELHSVVFAVLADACPPVRPVPHPKTPHFEESLRLQRPLRRPDGATLQADIEIGPVLTGDGGICYQILRLREAESPRSESDTGITQARLVPLTESSAHGIFRIDADGRLRTICPRIREQFPLPESGDWRDLVHPEDRETVSGESWQRTLREGIAHEVAYRFRHCDGGYRWCQVRALPILNDDGTIKEWVGTITDLTHQVPPPNPAGSAARSAARSAAETELLRSQDWLSFALEATEDGIWDWDVQSWSVQFSGRFLAMLDCPVEEGGSDFSFWVNRLHPDDVPEMLEMIREVRSGRLNVVRQELRVQCADGSYCWVLNRGKVVASDASGRPTRMVGTIVNISPSKQMEQQMVDLLAVTQARADQDSLTGLLNHGAFHRKLEEAIQNWEETDQSFAVAVLDLNHFKYFNDAYGHSAGDAILLQLASVLHYGKRPPDIAARLGGDEFALLMPGITEHMRDSVTTHLSALTGFISYQPEGYDFEIPLSAAFGLALCPSDGVTAKELLHAADERLRCHKQDSETTLTDELRDVFRQQVPDFGMLDALVSAVDNKDRYTRRHSEDVLLYSLAIAQELKFSGRERVTLMIAALIHDVGKIGVPDRILRLPGRLTEAEYEQMKLHVELGAALIGAVGGLMPTLDAVRYHHERWDGKGYPEGLRGEEIPRQARIMAAADAFSAMTTDRPYRRGLTMEQAIQLLQEGAGIQWDPVCVRALTDAFHSQSDFVPLLRQDRQALLTLAM